VAVSPFDAAGAIIAMIIKRHFGSSIRRRPATWLAAALLVLALAAPSAALAASPSNSQYEPQNHQIAVTGGGGGNGPSTPSHSTIGNLPFTGLDVGVLALAASALLGAGFALRRLSDPTRRSSS
jgi:hypothetical protein